MINLFLSHLRGLKRIGISTLNVMVLFFAFGNLDIFLDHLLYSQLNDADDGMSMTVPLLMNEFSDDLIFVSKYVLLAVLTVSIITSYFIMNIHTKTT